MDTREVPAEERVAFLEKQLAAARAGEAAAQFELIELQHRDLQQQERCDQLEKTVQKVNASLKSIQSELDQRPSGSPSDEDSDKAGKSDVTVMGLQLKCQKARLALLEAEIDSLRASRNSLLSLRRVEGGDASTEVQSLLQYTQELETLLDACTPCGGGTSALQSRRSTKHQGDFLHNARQEDIQLKSRLSKVQLEKHAADTISNASTSTGSRSDVQSIGEMWDDLSASTFLFHPSASLQSMPQEKDASRKVGCGASAQDDCSRKKKVEQRVRFRPQLRMNRDRSSSTSGALKRLSSSRRNSSRERPRGEQQPSATSWQLPDFTDWYG